jgi:hypothetical protein
MINQFFSSPLFVSLLIIAPFTSSGRGDNGDDDERVTPFASLSRKAANATSDDAAHEMCDGNVVERRSKRKRGKIKENEEKQTPCFVLP